MSALRTNAARRRRADPTRTTVLRNRYSTDLTRRFRRLKQVITRGIIERDVLGLSGRPRVLAVQPMPPVPEVPSFIFETDEGKVTAFMRWLREAEDAAILEVVAREGRTVSHREEWQNVYIRNAYQRGLDQALASMTAAGVSTTGVTVAMLFAQPIHADRIGILFTRNFSLLEGITEAMNAQIGRVLAEGIARGDGARKIARDLADRVDAIGVTRAKVLARTEIINAHASATLNTFEQFGVEGVSVMAEWATANDERVCEQCAALEGRTFTIQQARGMIPRHPNCRCAWIPVEVTTRERRRQQTSTRRRQAAIR